MSSQNKYQAVDNQNDTRLQLPVDNTITRNNVLYQAAVDIIDLLRGGYQDLSNAELATVIFNIISAILWIVNTTNLQSTDFSKILTSNYIKIAIAILAVVNVSLIISYILNVFRDKQTRIYLAKQPKTLVYWTVTNNNRIYYIGVKESNDLILKGKPINRNERIHDYKLIISSRKPQVNSPDATNFIWILVKNGKDDNYRNFYEMDKVEALSLYSLSASGYVCANRYTHKVDLATNLNEWERFNISYSENNYDIDGLFAIENTFHTQNMNLVSFHSKSCYLSFNDSANEASRELNITDDKRYIFKFTSIFDE